MPSRSVPVSIVETPEFFAATKAIMSEKERAALVDQLARTRWLAP